LKNELLNKVMDAFVGNGIQLTIRDGKSRFRIHTIQIMEKANESCPVKEINVGERFLRLLGTDQNNNEVAILCNWSKELLENLLENYTNAKEAGCSEIVLLKETSNPGNWLLLWKN